MRQARIAGAAASRRVESIRHCSEDLEPQVETGKTEKLGEQGRRGSQAQDTAPARAARRLAATNTASPLASQKLAPDRSMTIWLG